MARSVRKELMLGALRDAAVAAMRPAEDPAPSTAGHDHLGRFFVRPVRGSCRAPDLIAWLIRAAPVEIWALTVQYFVADNSTIAGPASVSTSPSTMCTTVISVNTLGAVSRWTR